LVGKMAALGRAGYEIATTLAPSAPPSRALMAGLLPITPDYFQLLKINFGLW
jgi:hypothetical protein